MTRAAVLTMARDERVFLPIWWHYYSRFFAADDIYILDHGSVDGSTAGGGFVHIPVDNPRVDWGWHRDMLQAQQHAMLERYDVVLVTDTDEIVAPDPQTGDLGSYIAAFSGEFVTCVGVEVIHLHDREPPFERSRGVLEQRGWWFSNPAYSKPLLASVPMQWAGGLHARTDGRTAIDERLYLIHLHRMDYALCLERHRARASMPWNRRDLEEGWGYQNRIVQSDAFQRWFYHDTCAGVPLKPRPIPPRWRSVV
jgi:hypothetical protein